MKSSRLSLLGCGIQGYTNLEALKTVFPLKNVMAFDTVKSQAEKISVFVEK